MFGFRYHFAEKIISDVLYIFFQLRLFWTLAWQP